MDQPTPGIHFGYAADAGRAALVDARVRSSLARSIEAVAGALAPHGLGDRAALGALARRIAAAPVRPLVFALYTGLVDAIQSDDDAAVADGALRLGGADLASEADFRIVDLGGEPLGAEASALYLVMLDDDPDMPIDIGGLGAVAFEAGRAGVLDALALLREAAPQFAGEVDTLCNEVVLGRSRGTAAAASTFSSASSPYLWGGIQLDPTGAGRIALAETLVHETSHALLNGLVDAGELSTNSRDARYSSPLRHDPRPMEGIIHAAYVLGRMTLALDEIAGFGGLSVEEKREAARRRHENAALFRQGIATIRAHATLTPAGAAALADCFALADRLDG